MFKLYYIGPYTDHEEEYEMYGLAMKRAAELWDNDNTPCEIYHEGELVYDNNWMWEGF